VSTISHSLKEVVIAIDSQATMGNIYKGKPKIEIASLIAISILDGLSNRDKVKFSQSYSFEFRDIVGIKLLLQICKISPQKILLCNDYLKIRTLTSESKQ